MWPVIDPTASILQLDPNLSTPLAGKVESQVGWYKGLQVAYLDGGRIPTKVVKDASGNDVVSLAVMDAAILNPSGSSFSAVTLSRAILFPAAPGDDGWSPLVRLHNVNLANLGGKKVGDYNGICQAGQTNCPASYIPYIDPVTKGPSLAAASFNTLFIVAPPQQ
jgi:hypothetical protein